MKRLLVDRIGIRDGKIVTQMEIYFSPFYLFRFVRILFVSFWAHSTGDHVGVTKFGYRGRRRTNINWFYFSLYFVLRKTDFVIFVVADIRCVFCRLRAEWTKVNKCVALNVWILFIYFTGANESEQIWNVSDGRKTEDLLVSRCSEDESLLTPSVSHIYSSYRMAQCTKEAWCRSHATA